MEVQRDASHRSAKLHLRLWLPWQQLLTQTLTTTAMMRRRTRGRKRRLLVVHKDPQILRQPPP